MLKYKIYSFKGCVIFGLILLLSGCNHLFYHPHEKIYLTPDKVELNYEDFQIQVGEGVAVKGWKIFNPTASRKQTAVLQFHGNAENRSTHFLSVAWLADEGADVVVFDYRGYNGSTGSPSRSGVVDDGVAVLKWFEKSFPESKRFVIGQSLGGAIASVAIAKSGVKIDGLILESTFHSYRGIARMKLASVWLLWPFQWLPWVLLSGNEDPIEVAPQLSVPVLAFHDVGDPVVPFEAGQKLYDQFPKNSTAVIPIDGKRHTSAFSEDRMENRSRALKFVGLNP